MRHPVETLWREVGLPEYFLGNDGSNNKLYALYDAIVDKCATVADKEANLLLFTGARLQSFSQATKLFYSEAELHDQAGTAVKVAADKIRGLVVSPADRGTP